MKQNIKLGNVVDDGQGDYLRRGGEKIQNNFNELYYELGDGEMPHSAGAWKTTDGGKDKSITVKFGQSLAVDTSKGSVGIQLPKGSVTDYNKVIRLRDVWQTWGTNVVRLTPADGDTIKGNPAGAELSKNFMDVELVYCSPGRWEYLENKQVNRISTSDLSTVAKREYIATQDQTDFNEIFGVNNYNTRNVEVYLRGNLLYYGDALTDDSNYGSIGEDDAVVPLDGKSIRLKIKCNAGDTVTIVTYMDGITSWRSSYTRKQIKLYDTSLVELESQPNVRKVGDLSKMTRLSIEDFGLTNIESINPNSLDVLINGVEQVRAGVADSPAFTCEGVDDAYTAEECAEFGGIWTSSNVDYDIEKNANDEVIALNFNMPFENEDVVVIKWYNGDIGTVMSWEGEDSIQEHADQRYLRSEEKLILKNTVEYEDWNNPSQKTMKVLPQAPEFRVENIGAFFDLVYPIGTIYKNAHNPANPRDYMGFGRWVRYKEAQGRALVGWNSDSADALFGLNNNDLDASGKPKHSAGGTVGDRSYTLQENNIPSSATTEEVLVKDSTGGIIIGGCQFDPDEGGPGYHKYREDHAHVNKDTDAMSFSLIQPSVTAHVWLRVA